MKDYTKILMDGKQIALWLAGELKEEEKICRAQIYTKKKQEEIKKVYNKKKVRDSKIEELITLMQCTIKNLWRANDIYKELYHKTEYWEKKSTYDFDFQNWNTIKKVNGRLTRYIKELINVKEKLENENY